MSEKIAKLNIKRESGYLYFVKSDSTGLLEVYRAKMQHGGRKKKSKKEEE